MNIFSNVSALKPHKTSFSPFHSNVDDMTFGELVPMFAIEMVPGDFFSLDSTIVGRLSSSLVAPTLAQFDLVAEAFFCPNRLLMGHDANFPVPIGEPNFEDVLSGGKDGNTDLTVPLMGCPDNGFTSSFTVGGIMDSLGEQIEKPTEPNVPADSLLFTGEDDPHCLVHRAYRWIWNEYYRNEFLQDEVQVAQYTGDGSSSDETFIESWDYDKVLQRGWRRDYFTSALPFQQFGDSPAFPISGTLPISFSGSSGALTLKDLQLAGLVESHPSNINYTAPGTSFFKGSVSGTLTSGSSSANFDVGTGDTTGNFNLPSGAQPDFGDYSASWNGLTGNTDIGSLLNATVDLQDAATFDISDVRTAFQIQKWKERNARAGIRYTEYLQAHFGTTPGDYRLQRPYFIGALRFPWYVSEVLQTSATQGSGKEISPQGNQAGQAIVLGKGNLGKFRAMEFGYLLILVSVLPKAQYQQGLSRHFSRRDRYSFYSPEFAHLSEQAILNREIFVSDDPEVNKKEFGFTGIWNELRFLPSRVGRHMRTNADTYSFDYWHQARYFNELPVLNSEFLSVAPDSDSLRELMRIFEVQDENPFIVHYGLNLTASRPLPFEATPGLVDHF